MGLSQMENIEMSTYATSKQSDIKSRLAVPSKRLSTRLSKKFGSKKSKSQENSLELQHRSQRSSNTVKPEPV